MEYILDEALITGIREKGQKFEFMLFDRFIGIENYYSIPPEAKRSLYVDTISDVIMNLRTKPYIQVENLKAYVKRILDNKFRKYYKLKLKEKERYAQMDREIFERTMEDVVESQLDPEKEAEMITLAKEIFKMLSDKCKEVLRARFVEGLSFRELSEELNYASEGSARLASHDCIKQAKKKSSKLKDRYYEE